MLVLDLITNFAVESLDKCACHWFIQILHLMSKIHVDNSDIRRRFPTNTDVCGCLTTCSFLTSVSADICNINMHGPQNVT